MLDLDTVLTTLYVPVDGCCKALPGAPCVVAEGDCRWRN